MDITFFLKYQVPKGGGALKHTENNLSFHLTMGTVLRSAGKHQIDPTKIYFFWKKKIR